MSVRPSVRRRRIPTQVAVTEGAVFLNIDLIVRSRRSLGPLAAAWPWAQRPRQLDGRVNPRWLILSPRGNTRTAEAAARMLLHHVEGLSPLARRCWNLASTRIFDIGVQAGMHPGTFEEVQLKADILRRIATTGARLQVTVYAPVP